jgi:nicotinate-nucleotide adenylyltransferase
MGRSVSNMSVALFGGTFNPVHFGHLRLANELAKLLQVKPMRMLPCAVPPHREEPCASAEQRLAMLELAIDAQPILATDDLELHRAKPSYTIDTLELVRQRIGAQMPLFFCMGMDSLAGINSWHRWRELLNFCHIVVYPRPTWEISSQEELTDWVDQHQCDNLSALKQSPAGHLYICDLPVMDLSSSEIRDYIKQGKNIDHMAPESVIEYIKLHSLYE